MATDNGDSVTVEGSVNRIGEAEVKTKKKKAAPKSKFREMFEFARDAEGTKPSSSLVRKTEEGSGSLTIKSFPEDLTMEGFQAAAHEVGLKLSLKSEVGNADASLAKSLAEENAEAWVEIICT